MSQKRPDAEEHDPEIDELVAGIERAERARKARTLMIFLVLAVLSIVALGGAWTYREALFVPKLDIEGGEREVLAETNDPQCRGMIGDVTKIGQEFAVLSPRIEQDILSDDLAKVKAVRGEITGVKDRLDDAFEASKEANLRFDDNRTELRKWFGYIKNELSVLDSVAENQIAALEPAPQEGADAGEGTVVEFDKQKARKPQTRLDGALLASDDAFEAFRVWHTSSLHPCGKADEDETPWTPEAALPGKLPATKP